MYFKKQDGVFVEIDLTDLTAYSNGITVYDPEIGAYSDVSGSVIPSDVDHYSDVSGSLIPNDVDHSQPKL